MFQRLVYYSAATQRVDDAELERILRTSRRNNGQVGVTGVLLFHEGSFFQVLEGPAAPVLRTFDRIMKDPRHVSVIRALNEPAEARAFADWSMGYTAVDQLEEAQRANFFDLRAQIERGDALPGARAGGAVEILIRNFVGSFGAARAV